MYSFKENSFRDAVNHCFTSKKIIKQALGISNHDTFQRMYEGMLIPRADILCNLCNAFDIPMSAFFTGIDETETPEIRKKLEALVEENRKLKDKIESSKDKGTKPAYDSSDLTRAMVAEKELEINMRWQKKYEEMREKLQQTIDEIKNECMIAKIKVAELEASAKK